MAGTILSQIQAEVGKWAQANFGDQVSKVTGASHGSIHPLLGVVEEIGELTHAVLKRHQGIRGMDVASAYQEARDDALGDILIYLCDFATREGVDLEQVLVHTAGKVLKRDWVAHPALAGTMSEKVERTYKASFDPVINRFILSNQQDKPLVEVDGEESQALVNYARDESRQGSSPFDPRLWNNYYAGVLHALAVAKVAQKITLST